MLGFVQIALWVDLICFTLWPRKIRMDLVSSTCRAMLWSGCWTHRVLLFLTTVLPLIQFTSTQRLTIKFLEVVSLLKHQKTFALNEGWKEVQLAEVFHMASGWFGWRVLKPNPFGSIDFRFQMGYKWPTLRQPEP